MSWGGTSSATRCKKCSRRSIGSRARRIGIAPIKIIRLVGVAGYGEGGLLALYSKALDYRIRAALVSGYFGPREEIWREPIYRNVWGLLRDFGDAELASMFDRFTIPDETGRTPNRKGALGGVGGVFVENCSCAEGGRTACAARRPRGSCTRPDRHA